MIQQPENKTISVEEILKILRNQAESMPPSPTTSRYLRALRSFQSSVFSHSYREADTARSADTAAGPYCEADTARSANTAAGQYSILNRAITDWLISLWLGGTPHTTASLYLDIISSLWGSAVKAGLLPKTTLFSTIKQRLKALGPDGWKSGIDDEIFHRALRLTKNAGCLISDDAVAADIVLWSLTHGLQSLTEVAMLKRAVLNPNEGIHASCAPESSGFAVGSSPVCGACSADTEKSLLSVITNNLSLGSGRRQYLFPLRQSRRTPKQLEKHIAQIVNALFRRARLPQATDPFQTVEALWAYAALSLGIPASALVARLGHAPLGLPVLKLCKSSESSQYCEADTARSADTFDESFAQIGKVFLDNPPRWYALSLRPGVRFTRLCRRLELLSQNAQRDTYNALRAMPQLFYPCEEIARAIGKQIVIKQRPFIHSVVFFHAKLTDIGRLLSRIGDLAWCYRQSARPGAPYAEISEQQFRLFQQTIARFTPDYEVAPSGELELKPNDHVEIVGGLFAGQTATFDSVVGTHGSCVREQSRGCAADAPATVYRLNIIGDNGIEWRISVDSRLTKQKD